MFSSIFSLSSHRHVLLCLLIACAGWVIVAQKTLDVGAVQHEHTTWMISYANIKKFGHEIRLHIQTQGMFPNKRIYQETLFIWDSIDHSWQDVVDVFGSHLDKYLFYDISKFEAGSAKSFIGHNCFKRGATYCRMEYLKTVLDEAVEDFCKTTQRKVPDVYAIIDGDTYFQTIPLHRHIFDKKNRLVTIGVGEENKLSTGMFAKGIQEVLIEPGFFNGMYIFPFFVWSDTLANMRKKIIELHGGHKSWLEIVVGLKYDMCEFCVMGTYTLKYESHRYRHIFVALKNTELSPETIMSQTNMFHDSSDSSVPFTRPIVHDKVKAGHSHDTIRKGCCLSYGLVNSACTGLTVNDHYELVHEDLWHHTYGWSSPTLLADHYREVHERLIKHPSLYIKAKELCSVFVDRFTAHETALVDYLASDEMGGKKILGGPNLT